MAYRKRPNLMGGVDYDDFLSNPSEDTQLPDLGSKLYQSDSPQAGGIQILRPVTPPQNKERIFDAFGKDAGIDGGGDSGGGGRMKEELPDLDTPERSKRPAPLALAPPQPFSPMESEADSEEWATPRVRRRRPTGIDFSDYLS
jgi:hypothetical protein